MDAARSVTATFDLEPAPTFLLTSAWPVTAAAASAAAGRHRLPDRLQRTYADGTAGDPDRHRRQPARPSAAGAATAAPAPAPARSPWTPRARDRHLRPGAGARDGQPVGHADRYAGSGYGRKRDPLLPHRHQLRAGRRDGRRSGGHPPCRLDALRSRKPWMHERLGRGDLRHRLTSLRRVRNISIVVLAPTVATMTTITNTATVSGNEDDPSLANNTSSEMTSVQPPATNPDTASGWITAAGGTVATNAAKPPTKKDPMTTAVTVPPGFPGMVTIAEGPITTCPTGVVCFGQRAEITAPDDDGIAAASPGLLATTQGRCRPERSLTRSRCSTTASRSRDAPTRQARPRPTPASSRWRAQRAR